ncbi:hypothetical protein [Bacillus gaemokensis]|uniref:Uncharacterized protein n=1 Tax=Bacillus gaemokensis TaxID=574375 RepID=A0A073KBW2_9BACI|nr:hypothetical protein [Bacillus gaemokensis]KEK23917.1 hypothetical protein BAGA_05695 [Bacillus gaemokensis]KYG38040.1 hypothetical protein AZF08_19965 [Bacillus gaemokensis]
MNHNKKGQSYVIDSRFRLTEAEGVVEYCRVRFLQTGNTQVIPHKIVETGEFEDLSLVKVLKAELSQEESDTFRELLKDAPMITLPIIEKSNAQVIGSSTTHIEPVTTTLVHKGEPSKPVTLELKTDNLSNSVTLVDNVIKPKEFVAIATSPKGKEIKVTDLEAFCKVNKLDLEAVQSVLEGKQKTHRKWRFTQA